MWLVRSSCLPWLKLCLKKARTRTHDFLQKELGIHWSQSVMVWYVHCTIIGVSEVRWDHNMTWSSSTVCLYILKWDFTSLDPQWLQQRKQPTIVLLISLFLLYFFLYFFLSMYMTTCKLLRAQVIYNYCLIDLHYMSLFVLEILR